jgi:hypothetical protein
LCGAKLSDNSLLRPSIGPNQEVHGTQGGVQPPTATFLLTSECTAQEIAQQVKLAGASTVQIVSYPSLREYEKLLTLLPMTQRAQVIHVEDESALDMIEQYAPYVDIFLIRWNWSNTRLVDQCGIRAAQPSLSVSCRRTLTW